jgi:hypothetical protein
MPDEELIEELSEMGGHPCRAHLPMGERLRQAADRIKALTAEVERLASVATDFASSLIVAENNLSHVSEENERLREALFESVALNENYYAVEEDDGYQFTEAPAVIAQARTALEKQP